MVVVKIVARDSNARAKKVGEVRWVGGHVRFDLPTHIIKFLKGLKFEDTEQYVRDLHLHLTGTRLWATKAGQ